MQVRALSFAFCACLLLGGSSGAVAETAREILARSLEPRDPTYTGVQESHFTGSPGKALRPQQTVYRKGNRLRIEYRNGQVLFDDGSTSQLYLPRQKLVERGPSQLESARVRSQRRALSNKRIEVTQLPDGEVAGRPTYVIQVKPPKGGVRRVWIDTRTYVQLRLDATRPDGRTSSTYFTSIDFDKGPPEEKLTLSVPPDVTYGERGHGRPIPVEKAIQLARAWGGLLRPRVVPEGYGFRGFYRHSFNGRPVLVSVYDGPGAGNTLTIFQGPAIGSGAMAERKNHLHVLSTRKGSADVTLIAPLPEEDLKRVMDSM